MENTRLLYSEADNLVIVRVEGRGTWVESKPFLEFAKQKIGEGKEIAIDLSACRLLDSTFLGSLAYLRLNKGGIEIYRPNEEVKRAIKTLGLGEILKETEIPERCGENKEIKEKRMTREEQAETILLAHKSLIKIEPKNLPKFHDLIEMVEKEIEKK